MNSLDGIRSSLQGQGITGLGDIFYNLTTAELYEHAVIMGEAEISEHGALLCNTAPNTGR
ncbi:MAG: phosphoenolpyruvate carboxykinase (ATP), partial [Candidatus Kapabacteria bacterium]|nr:phosphoenolpyruvate carboxykinase (ATP) [Candidatus Kapabacteria bacterium]